MKKATVVFVALVSFSQNAFACLCAGEIAQSFKEYETELKLALKAQQNSLMIRLLI